MNDKIVPEHRERPNLDTVAMIGFAVLIPLVFLIAACLYAFGFGVTFIALLVLLGIAGGWLFFRHIHLHFHHTKHLKLERKEREHAMEIAKEALRRDHSVQLEYPSGHKIITTSPLTIPNGPVTVKELKVGADVPQIAAPLTLPDKQLLVDVIRRWDLTPNHLFLALAKGSREIACTLEGLMHVAHDAPTGGGKTSQWMAEIVQLLKLGVQVILCNPHFAPMGKRGEDWRPVGRAIEMQGLIEIAPDLRIPGLIRQHENIANMLKWLSTVEIDRRFDLQAQGDYSYKPLYVFIDEWPAVVRRYPDAAEYLVDTLQRGRAVEVCVDTNAQGFLQEDVDLKGSARENFNTAYHMGGSVFSGAKLLDMPVKDMNALLRAEQVTLGQGIAMLRNNQALPQAELVRLPYAENTYVYYMLGRADGWMLPEYRKRGNDPFPDTETTSDEDTVIVPEEGATVYRPGNDDLSVNATASVGNDIRETIRRMNNKGIAHRDIAYAVGLSGRNYGLYQAVCRELGIKIE